MKKRNKLYVILAIGLIAMFTVMGLVSGQPPFQQSPTDIGLILEVPATEFHKQSTDLILHVHVYNSSNGLLFPTSSTSCYAHVYSYTLGGVQILSNITLVPDSIEFEYTIPGQYFSEVGVYTNMIWCNSSTNGGFFQYSYDVTPSGDVLNIPNAIMYSLLLIMMSALLVFLITGVNKATRAEWQIGYICASYIVLWSLMFLSWVISDNYLYQIEILETVFFLAWLILGTLLLPFLIIVSSYALGKQAEELMVDKYQKQGYSKEESLEFAKSRKK